MEKNMEKMTDTENTINTVPKTMQICSLPRQGSRSPDGIEALKMFSPALIRGSLLSNHWVWTQSQTEALEVRGSCIVGTCLFHWVLTRSEFGYGGMSESEVQRAPHRAGVTEGIWNHLSF
jgi:hypothetical protein